jgi:hypothetical protein
MTSPRSGRPSVGCVPSWIHDVTGRNAPTSRGTRVTEFGKKASSVSEADVQKVRSKLAAGTN